MWSVPWNLLSRSFQFSCSKDIAVFPPLFSSAEDIDQWGPVSYWGLQTGGTAPWKSSSIVRVSLWPGRKTILCSQFSSTEMQFVGFHFENGFWNRYKSIIRQICTGHNHPSIKSGLTITQESWCVRCRDLWETNRECSSILESSNNYLAGASIFCSPRFNSLYWWLLMQWKFFNVFHEVLNISMALTCTILVLCLVKWILEQVLCRH